ncbi:MAG TPA: ParB/RepB/Spo0J family partition protein [Terriglobia bacterium]
MTRKALGRGLSALIREPESPQPSEIQQPASQIPTDIIDPSPFQPRSTFAGAELRELADSILAKGVIQPVLLRRAGNRYQLVAGERRWRAAKLAGLDSVPAIVRELDDREALELALTENILRDDLGPLEAAGAYRTLQERFGATQEDIASRLGINRVTVTNTLRLLKLPRLIQEMIERGDLTAGHARALLSVPAEAEQLLLAERIVKGGLSVREAERLAAQPVKPKHGPAEAGSEPKLDPNLRAAVVELERRLGTRVTVTGNGQRGKIEISYFSGEDLSRIYEIIIAPAPDAYVKGS